MTADRNSDEMIAKILAEARVFAVIGASNKEDRPSYRVMQTLIEKGYTVHPVNPGRAGQEILGRRVYASLADVPAPADVVDIFRNSAEALDAVRDAIALKDKLGLRVVWMQLGVINSEAADEAEAAGLMAVMDRCPRIELGRLASP
jgi:predicted CoA-binding protein